MAKKRADYTPTLRKFETKRKNLDYALEQVGLTRRTYHRLVKDKLIPPVPSIPQTDILGNERISPKTRKPIMMWDMENIPHWIETMRTLLSNKKRNRLERS